jgi:hypothetical protein
MKRSGNTRIEKEDLAECNHISWLKHKRGLETTTWKIDEQFVYHPKFGIKSEAFGYEGVGRNGGVEDYIWLNKRL